LKVRVFETGRRAAGQAELSAIAKRLENDFPETNRGHAEIFAGKHCSTARLEFH
jgi:hypothetical protein